MQINIQYADKYFICKCIYWHTNANNANILYANKYSICKCIYWHMIKKLGTVCMREEQLNKLWCICTMKLLLLKFMFVKTKLYEGSYDLMLSAEVSQSSLHSYIASPPHIRHCLGAKTVGVGERLWGLKTCVLPLKKLKGNGKLY